MSIEVDSQESPSWIPFHSTDAYFSRLAPPNVPQGEPSELLSAIRRALQHHESPSVILGRISQVSPDGETVEELAWGRMNVVSILGGRVQKQWTFPQEHEEVRAVCWAYFEEKTSRRMPPQPARSDLSQEASRLFQQDTMSVFGPYAQKMNQKPHRPSTVNAQGPEDGPYGPGTGAMVRAVCIIFRSFAQIQLEDGTEHCINLPFLTRCVWPLFPVGFALEQEPPPDIPRWASSLDLDPIIHSISSPLRAIAPLGVAHSIHNTTSGTPLIYQEDLPHPNQNKNTFSSLNNGERVIFVSPYSSSSPQVIFTVDTRLMSIHCYSYVYAPIENPADDVPIFRNAGSEQPSPRDLLLDDDPQLIQTQSLPGADDNDAPKHHANGQPKPSSQWLMEDTPPPASWRDTRHHEDDDEFELNAQISVMNSVLMELHDDDDEEIVVPDHWLQRIGSLLIDPESIENWSKISVINFNDTNEPHLAASYAIMLPAIGVYRLVHVFWDQQVPLIAKSSLIARIDNTTYPALAVVNVQALRKGSHDLLVLQPDNSFFLISGSEYYALAVAHDAAKPTGPLHLIWTQNESQHANYILNRPVKVQNLQQGVGATAILETFSKTHAVSFDLSPQNLLTQDILNVLSYSLPIDKLNAIRRRYLQLWMSNQMPKGVIEELHCLWTALFEILKCDNPSFSKSSNIVMDQPFNEMASSSAHKRLADDSVLFKFKLPQQPSDVNMSLGSTLSPLAAPVLLALHILGQSLKVDVGRRNELPLLLPAVLRLSNKIAPEWTDYWSRLRPDLEGAWNCSERGQHTWNTLPVAAPDFVEHCLNGRSWTNLESVPDLFGLSPAVLSLNITNQTCTNLKDLSLFFSMIWRNTRVRDLGLSEELAHAMVERNWTLESIDNLPVSLAIPIREVLKTCQISPRMTYSLETYRLIDRDDLYEFVKGTSANYNMPTTEVQGPYTVGSIVQSASRDASGNMEADANSGNLTKDLFTEIRWTEDRRVDEVQLMLQSSRTPVVKIQYTLPPNEHEKENAALVLRISERTLSLPPGRALFTYGCLTTATPEAYVIPKIELSVRVMPLNVVMVLEQAKLTSETKKLGRVS